MKATLALTVANAMLVASNPLQQRAYVTQVDVKTVTQYVYPDGSPATDQGPQPTNAGTTETISQPAGDSQDAPSSSAPSSGKEDGESSEQPSSSSGGEEEQPSQSGGGDGGSGGESGGGGDTPDDVYQAAMNAHNAHRANHTCSEVKWDPDLASWAQELADTCVYDHNTDIGGKGGYGQNIAMGAQTNYELTDGQAIARAITRQWYNDEFELYPAWGVEPSKDKFDDWGHLTQIVWKKTTKIGCAIAHCPAGGNLAGGMEGYFAVCNYDPPGNADGEYTTNVLPPIKHDKVLPA